MNYTKKHSRATLEADYRDSTDLGYIFCAAVDLTSTQGVSLNSDLISFVQPGGKIKPLRFKRK